MRIALGQINTTIGDFEGNLARMRDVVERARSAGADLVLFPELATCGYPPMDLLERPSFLRDQERALAEFAAESGDFPVVTGAITQVPDGRPRKIANAAVALVGGRIAHTQAKTLLPTYDVFDESRYFQPAVRRELWEWGGRRIGLAICEDVWSGEFWGPNPRYDSDPVAELCAAGAELLLVVSASPWEQGKGRFREAMLRDASQRHAVPIVFCNLVGGNDELIFDGGSFVTDARGRVVHRSPRFCEDLALVEPFAENAPEAPPEPHDVDLLEGALVLGVRDYFDKLGLNGAVVAISGGIDSAVTAYIAARALGPERVLGIMMPGPFSSDHSVSDAAELGRLLGFETRLARIEGIYKGFLEQFAVLFGAQESYGLTQENLQARIRGTLLMAVSNFEDRIVLATGNKSELSMGYTTLYGDLVGGLAVLGDVLKGDVYRIARNANRERPSIPVGSIEKPPSAELAPDQLDSDSLPPYDALDAILTQAIERGVAGDRIEPPAGTDAATVGWVLRQLDRNEYKRRQAPVVLRVSPKAFGTGRRLPIVHKASWGV
jgi:NAD+ synthase (glutamine-hydrolysing)